MRVCACVHSVPAPPDPAPPAPPPVTCARGHGRAADAFGHVCAWLCSHVRAPQLRAAAKSWQHPGLPERPPTAVLTGPSQA